MILKSKRLGCAGRIVRTSGHKECMQNLDGKTYWKIPTYFQDRGDNIKMDLGENGYDDERWMTLVEHRV
jgi:hypothetical protein